MNLGTFSLDYFSLAGKTAVVTGGNMGIGLACSTALAKAGANVFVASLSDNAECQAQIESEGVKYAFIKSDITANGAPANIINQCSKEIADVDILVNNAGICHLNSVLEFDRNQWDPMMAVNLTAAFELSREAAKIMVPRKSGKIINICSLFSFLGGLGSPAYAASKHGIVGLTRAYCDELGGHNIQVNGIAPGYIETDISKHTRETPELNQKVMDHLPAGRWGKTEDLMGSVVFLASQASNYVSGHILTVDGGYLVR